MYRGLQDTDICRREHNLLLLNRNQWPSDRIESENPGEAIIIANVVAKTRPFAGYAPAVFRYVIIEWKKICGGLPAAE